MQKAVTWLFGGVLFCVLLVDLIFLNYSQRCSLYVQLDTAGLDDIDNGGSRRVEVHARAKTGTVCTYLKLMW